MSVQYTPATSRSGTAQPAEVGVRVSGRLLRLARFGWVVLAVLIVGLYVAAVPIELARLQAVCLDGRRCGLTPELARQLVATGFNKGQYATYFTVLDVTFAAVYATVALILFWRKSTERMALFSAYALLAFGAATFPNSLQASSWPDAPWRWLAILLALLGSTAVTLFLYLFPSGRFTPRWVVWLAVPWLVAQAIHYLFPATSADYSTWPPALAGLIFGSGLVPAICAQVYRYRHVSGPVQRQQTKWIVFGLSAALGMYLGLYLFIGLVIGRTLLHSLLGIVIAGTIIYGVMLLIPLSIALAILRYRLWEIDLLINRTLVYSALTACILILYVLGLGMLSSLFQTRGSLAASIVATGLVVLLFQPLHARLQRAVNRLLYGERDDPYAVLSRLGQHLEGTMAPEAVLSGIVETITSALKLPYAAITLEGDDRAGSAAASGVPVPVALTLPLVYQGESVGTLVLGPRAPGEDFSPADRRLLADLARQAGVAVHTVRLTADLQQARERLVSAREEERRRLRRDLHDGLGPQLGSQTLTLSAARKLLWHDPAAADALLADATTHAQAAVLDIRRLVYDLRPPALDDLGLVAALREQAVQYELAGLRVTVDAPEPLPPLPAAVEVACYRIVQEALTNVVRHAHARACSVRLAIDDALCLEIRDDGQGFLPDRHAGVGLASMRERAAELGGSCTIDTVAGEGTRVCASLPLPREGR